MKTLVKTVTIFVISIFCLACTPNVPDLPIYIHQSGWGYSDYYDYVVETMQRRPSGQFSYTGTWKGGTISLSTNSSDYYYDWDYDRYDVMRFYEWDISGASDLYWGEIVQYIYSPSSQSLEIIPTGTTPTYYCYCDYEWKKMSPDKDGTFSCIAYHGNDHIYINTLVPHDKYGNIEEKYHGSLEFYYDYYDGSRIKYIFNPKTQSLTTTKL